MHLPQLWRRATAHVRRHLPIGQDILGRAEAMMRHLRAQDRVFHPSQFWDAHLRWNLEMIQRDGIENFKRSVPQNYFTWMLRSPADPQMEQLLKTWLQDLSPAPLSTEIRGSSEVRHLNQTFLRTPTEARVYSLFVGLLWWLAQKGDEAELAARLEEPAIGNPIPIFADGRRISQDLANSLREYRRLRPALMLRPGEPRPALAEIGAGYGRLGYVAHRLQPLRYWIFDIPPALTIAEWYLPRALPRLRVFRWRPFANWADVAEEALAADLAFFTVDQMTSIPDGSARVFAAISALHEMRHDQIAAYVAEMTRIASAGFYTKNWTYSHNRADAVEFTADLIRPPADWQRTFARQDDVHPAFTEVLYTRASQT